MISEEKAIAFLGGFVAFLFILTKEPPSSGSTPELGGMYYSANIGVES